MVERAEAKGRSTHGVARWQSTPGQLNAHAAAPRIQPAVSRTRCAPRGGLPLDSKIVRDHGVERPSPAGESRQRCADVSLDVQLGSTLLELRFPPETPALIRELEFRGAAQIGELPSDEVSGDVPADQARGRSAPQQGAHVQGPNGCIDTY